MEVVRVNAERAYWLRQMREAREKLRQLEDALESEGSGRFGGPETPHADSGTGVEALRESEELYRLLAENSTDMISKHTPEGVYTYVSPACETLLGYEPQELVGRSAYDFFHPDDLKEIREAHSTILSEQDTSTVSYRIRRKDGEYTWFETTSRTVRSEAGEVQEIVAVSRDITERRRVEAGLQEAEHRYRALIEQVPAVIYTSEGVESPGSTNYVSPQIEALSGYTPEDFIENPGLWKEILHPEDRDRVLAETAHAIEAGEILDTEYRMIARDGREVWVQDEAVLVRDEAGHPLFWQGVKLDISQQKRAEQQLRETGARITSILESTTDAFFALDHQRRFTFVNERAAQTLQQAREDLLGASVERAFPMATNSRFYAECRRAVVSGEETHFEEFYAPLGKWFEVHAYPYEEGLAIYFRDITERKEGERQLREAEERFRSAFDNTPVGMAVVSLDGRYMQVNRAFCELLGYSEEELLEKTYLDLTYPEDYKISVSYARRVDGGALDSYTLEKRYVHAEGYPVWVSLSISLVKDPDGKSLHYIAQIQGIEERKQAEAALREDAERLAAIISTQHAIVMAEPDQRSVMKLIVERSRELTKADGAVVEMLEGEELLYHTASGKAREHVGLRLNLSSSISGECVRRKEILRSDDTEQDPRVDQAATRQTKARSLVVVPLYHRQAIVGVLKVFSTEPHAFSNRDVDTLQLMAGLAAAAMSHTAEFEAKQELLNERTASLIKIRQSEERFRTIFEGAASGIAILDLDGRVLQSNNQLQKMLGYSGRELEDLHFSDITHPDDLQENVGLHRELAAGERGDYEMEKRYLRKDGSLLWGRLKASLVRNPDGMPNFTIGMVEDITDRKRAEEELRKRAQQQAMVARLGQRALAGVELYNLLDEATTLISETLGTEYAKFLELQPDGEALLLRAGAGWKKGYVGNATVDTGVNSQSGYTLLSSEPVVAEDLQAEDRFGESGLQRDHGVVSGMSVVVHGPNRPFGVLGVDTTTHRTFTEDDVNFLQAVANVLAGAMARARTEDALRKSEREYRRLFELANDAILIYEPKSRKILDVNANACEIYGYPRETFVSMSMKEISLDRQRVHRYLETLLDRGSYQDFETVHRRQDGTPMNVLVNSSVIEFRGKRAVLSINRDITARKRTEASLMEIREAERRRIARDLHDAVLQDLSGTLQGLQAFKMESNGNGAEVELENEIDALRRAVVGLRGAIYDLRQEKEESFVRAVESLVELNRQLTPERQITLSVDEGFTSELRREVSVELLRVLQEALANTRHHSDARVIKVSLCEQEEDILAKIYDDGRGFDPDTSRGGVGLSGMRERVEELDGELEITSKPGKGTLVKVRVPYRVTGMPR
ncbi:MAG TPA: PAS domain S-box protein [Rubrobacteraceae bacterium]|nr:PAS domain S-box protein [Rubrobacteraceae bacterium]